MHHVTKSKYLVQGEAPAFTTEMQRLAVSISKLVSHAKLRYVFIDLLPTEVELLYNLCVGQMHQSRLPKSPFGLLRLEVCIVALAGPPPADLSVFHGSESELHGRGGLHLVFLDFGFSGRERSARSLLLGVVPHLLMMRRRRAEGRSDDQVEESLERVVPATGQGERDGKGGRFGHQGCRQRAGMGCYGGGGGREDAAGEAAGGAPPPPH